MSKCQWSWNLNLEPARCETVPGQGHYVEWGNIYGYFEVFIRKICYILIVHVQINSDY